MPCIWKVVALYKLMSHVSHVFLLHLHEISNVLILLVSFYHLKKLKQITNLPKVCYGSMEMSVLKVQNQDRRIAGDTLVFVSVLLLLEVFRKIGKSLTGQIEVNPLGRHMEVLKHLEG